MAQSNNKAAQEMAAAHATAVQEAKDKRVVDNEAISAGNAAATEASTPTAAAAAPSAPSTSTAATAAAAAAATEDEDAMPGFDDAPTDIITATDEDDVADMIASARAADEVAINGDTNPNVEGNPYPNSSHYPHPHPNSHPRPNPNQVAINGDARGVISKSELKREATAEADDAMPGAPHRPTAAPLP